MWVTIKSCLFVAFHLGSASVPAEEGKDSDDGNDDDEDDEDDAACVHFVCGILSFSVLCVLVFALGKKEKK